MKYSFPSNALNFIFLHSKALKQSSAISIFNALFGFYGEISPWASSLLFLPIPVQKSKATWPLLSIQHMRFTKLEQCWEMLPLLPGIISRRSWNCQSLWLWLNLTQFSKIMQIVSSVSVHTSCMHFSWSILLHSCQRVTFGGVCLYYRSILSLLSGEKDTDLKSVVVSVCPKTRRQYLLRW